MTFQLHGSLANHMSLSVTITTVYQLNGPVTHMMTVEMILTRPMNFVVSLFGNIQCICFGGSLFTWNTVSNRTCPSDQFACDSGQCTFESWVCDGEQDCEDNSDEKSCM